MRPSTIYDSIQNNFAEIWALKYCNLLVCASLWTSWINNQLFKSAPSLPLICMFLPQSNVCKISFILFLFSPLQLFDYQSYTYTYLLADKAAKEAILIDPVIELVKRDCNLLEDLDLKLKFASKWKLNL